MVNKAVSSWTPVKARNVLRMYVMVVVTVSLMAERSYSAAIVKRQSATLDKSNEGVVLPPSDDDDFKQHDGFSLNCSPMEQCFEDCVEWLGGEMHEDDCNLVYSYMGFSFSCMCHFGDSITHSEDSEHFNEIPVY